MISTYYKFNTPSFTGYKPISISKLENYLKEGKTVKEIALLFQVSERTIYNLMKNFNIKKPQTRTVENTDNIMRSIAKQKLTLTQMIKITGLSKYAIVKWYKEQFAATPKILQKQELISLLQSDLTNKEIAEQLDVSINTIKSNRQKYKLSNKKRKKESLMNKILEKLQQGIDRMQIAEEIGISYSTVNKYLRSQK